MKLGASTIPHAKEPLTPALLASYREAGIESLELCDYHPNFDYEDEGFLADTRSALSDLGLHLNSLHIHLRHRDETCDLAALDQAQWQRSIDEHKKTVNFAAALGGCILVTHDIQIPEPDEPESLSRRSAFVDALSNVADYAGERGVRIALENLGRGYTRTPDRLVGLMDDLATDTVGVVIDTGHRNLSGDPAETLRTVGEHLITLHLHDNHGAQDEHLLPGRGAINWSDVRQALIDVEYRGVFMYEINRPEDLPDLVDNARWIQSQAR